MTKKLTVVLAEDRSYHSAQRRMQQAVVAGLRGRPGLDLVIMPHLYDLAAEGPGMEFLRSVRGDLIVLGWLYPRAAYWVLAANNVVGRMGHTSFFPDEELESLPPLPAGGRRVSRAALESPHRTIWCVDLRNHEEAEPVLDEVERIAAEVVGPTFVRGEDVVQVGSNGMTTIAEPTRPRWYPVVDYDRCGNCQKCKEFCPFEVFGVDDQGTVLVERPDNCTGGCTACARICASGAILIVQRDSPAIAGDSSAPRDGMASNAPGSREAAKALDRARAERERAVLRAKVKAAAKR